MYATLEQLLIKVILGESFEEELQKIIGFYHDDFNDDILRVKLRTLPAMIGQGEGYVNIRTLLKQLIKPIRTLASEVVKMIKLFNSINNLSAQYVVYILISEQTCDLVV